MSAAAAIIERARNAGVTLVAHGEKLTVEGPEQAVQGLVPVLKAHKPEILQELTRPAEAARQALESALHESAREQFEERAGIAEHDGGQSREAAEALAREQTERWRRACWERFRQAADRIMSLPHAEQEQALKQYHREKVGQYGAETGALMLREMAGWIRFRTELGDT